MIGYAERFDMQVKLAVVPRRQTVFCRSGIFLEGEHIVREPWRRRVRSRSFGQQECMGIEAGGKGLGDRSKEASKVTHGTGFGTVGGGDWRGTGEGTRVKKKGKTKVYQR